VARSVTWLNHDLEDEGIKTDEFLCQAIGDPGGLKVLELGAGTGWLTLWLASRGARITAVDISERSLDLLQQNAAAAGVTDQITTCCSDAMNLSELDWPFDLVVGRFVLHHLRPFDTFADMLSRHFVSGRAVFLENSACNPLLMFVRQHIVGHWGIRRFSDEEERPLDHDDEQCLRARFSEVLVSHPELVMFGLVQSHLPWLGRPGRLLVRLDEAVGEMFPALCKWSYLQVIEFGP
jgi:SAM-dependent methyltransferase